MSRIHSQSGFTEDSVETILQRYRAEDFFFSSSEGVFLARDWQAEALTTNNQSVNSLETLLKKGFQNGQIAPIVFAALPFDQDAQGIMYLPKDVFYADFKSCVDQKSFSVLPQIESIEAFPDQKKYEASIELIQEEIEQNHLAKAVLARTLRIRCRETIETKSLLKRLWQVNHHAYVFAVPFLKNDQRAQFLGASPELMLRKTGEHISVHPLAGSMPRDNEALQDKKNADFLITSEKNRREHAFVIEAIADQLNPLCKQLRVPTSPSLLATPRLWHLGTLIEGQLKDVTQNSLSLAQRLHPTPAVCGYPHAQAYDLIRQLEPFERHLFSGLVGYCHANGDGQWALALRCAEVQKNELTLYAGAGIVAQSNPESEYFETGTKFTTFLSAIGLPESQLQTDFMAKKDDAHVFSR